MARDPADKALIALFFFLVLAAGGWFLVTRMSANKTIQDCVMAGHKNCAAVDDPEPR
jgi:hypothetical protein